MGKFSINPIYKKCCKTDISKIELFNLELSIFVTIFTFLEKLIIMTIKEKIAKLRLVMSDKKINAVIIPSSDPHLSEYIADRWKAREWFSGFNGSAGTLVVTKRKAALWTDSRYFLQAERQLKQTNIRLMKMGLSDTPDIYDWIFINTPENGVVAFDGECLSSSIVKDFSAKFSKKDIRAVSDFSLINNVWENRPEIPSNNIFSLDLKYCGKSRASKIKDLQNYLIDNNTEAIILTALDDIAWTFNLRGSDIKYNPVFISFAIITKEKSYLFTNKSKISEKDYAELAFDNVEIQNYNNIYFFVIEANYKSVIVNTDKINYRLFNTLNECSKIIDSKTIPTLSKAIKNEIEIGGMKNAHLKDGVALTKFFIWLEKTLEKRDTSELEITEKLQEFRSQQSEFIDESFSSIVGYKGNGAIIHYSATPETNATIKKDGFLLIDSGAQYLDGTTDITRTIHLSTPTEIECRDYTTVLRGHINLAKAKFPYGTRGSQLDVIARMPFWENALNYGHGTGHGIGCFLNVHEGPQSIRPQENPQIIEAGMITSNEPGIYIKDKYGIRIENLILACESEKNDFDNFMNFETITYCFIDKTAINKNLMLPNEIEWFNNYHKQVFDLLSPHLNTEETNWLKQKTSEL